jgi:hypothetical protein
VAPRMDGPAFGDEVATITAPQPDAVTPQLDRPAFTDDTGRRAGVLQWGGRGFCLMGAVLCAALAVTLQAHVLLPSLEKAFLGSSEGLTRAGGGVSHTLGADAAPRTKLRGESSRTGVAGQRIQLAKPTLESAATATRQVGETPITDQRAQRATGTSATAVSDTQPVARTATPSALPPTTDAEDRSTRAGDVRGSGAAGKAKASAVAKAYKPSAAAKARNPHAAPKIWNPRSAIPGCRSAGSVNSLAASGRPLTPYRSCRLMRRIPHGSSGSDVGRLPAWQTQPR